MRRLSLLATAALIALASIASIAYGAAGDVTRLSLSSSGAQGNGFSESPSISGDGTVTAFTSAASNLVTGDTNAATDVFVRDASAGTTTRVSVTNAGGEANGRSQLASISADGRYVAFESSATNLVSGDTNGVSDVFVRDRELGTTTRVSVSTGGAQGTKASDSAAISADGRFVAFRSAASELVSGDANGYTDIFVRNLSTGTTSMASVNSGGAQGLYDSWAPTISADGRYVAYTSLSVNLVSDDKNRRADVFVHDTQAKLTSRASVSTRGTEGDNVSGEPVISGDGRYVAMQTDATNLVPGDTNAVGDIIVRDRQAATTTRISEAQDGTQANARSYNPDISRDGRFVSFGSTASNLVSGDTNGAFDIFARDLHLNRLERLSLRNGGGQANNTSVTSSLSDTGRYVAFRSLASDMVTGDTNATADVFRRDNGVADAADMALTIADAADPVAVDADIRYTLTARNAGTATVTGARVSNPIPDGATYVSSSASQGSCSYDGTKVTCALGTVAPGATPTVTVVLRRSTVGTVTDTATVAIDETDEDPSNNTATESTSVAGAGKPDLSLTQVDKEDPVSYGTTITYTLTARNEGTADATRATVTDAVPANTTFVSADPSQGACTTASGTVSCALGTLQPASSATVKLVVRPTAEGSVTNRASIAGAEAEDDTTDNSSSESTTVGPARPSLTVANTFYKPAVTVGENISYKITVTENGPATSTGVKLTDPNPADTTFVSVSSSRGTCAYDSAAATTNCSLGTLGPGQTATVWLTLRSTVEQVVRNTATAEASAPDVDPSDNSATQSTRATRVSEYPDTTWQTNGYVDSIVYSNGVMYLGGQFTSVRPARSAPGTGEVARNNVAAVNASTGELLAWNPNVNGTVNTMVVSNDGARIYLGGEFTSVGGLFRNHIAAVTTSGTPTSWDPNVYSYVKALALSPDGSRIYAGGTFKTVNGQPRARIAAINTADRNLVPTTQFSASIEYPSKPDVPYVTALRVSADGNHLYVGGVFDAVNGELHKSAVKLSLPSGTPVAGWDAGIEKKENREESQVYDIVTRGPEVFLCGDFYKVRGRVSPNLAVVSSADGTHRIFPATDGAINACAISGDRLYLGGHFENIRPNGDDFTNLLPRNHIASFDIDPGKTTIWDPVADSIPGIYAFAVTPQKLAVGGYFSKIGRYTPQQGFAEFSGQP